MFDLGISELMVVAVVGLIVLGPERLPQVAKQVGQWLGKLQRYVSDVKSDINRQMELEELRKLQTQVKDAASNLESSFRSSVDETQSELDSISDSLKSIGESGSSQSSITDWDKVYEARRTREKIVERRQERDKALGKKLPKRR